MAADERRGDAAPRMDTRDKARTQQRPHGTFPADVRRTEFRGYRT